MFHKRSALFFILLVFCMPLLTLSEVIDPNSYNTMAPPTSNSGSSNPAPPTQITPGSSNPAPPTQITPGSSKSESLECNENDTKEKINYKIDLLKDEQKKENSKVPNVIDNLLGCQTLLSSKEKNGQCSEEEKKIKEAGFGKACAQFSRGMDCTSAITACAMCPSPEEDISSSSYDCVTVHQKTKCPLLAGEELKNAKEKRDKLEEEIKEQEEEIVELERDIVDKKNELNKSLAELEEEFTNTVSEMERETANLKEDLDADLKTNKSAIKAEVSKQMAEIQGVINQSLEVAHSFENAVTKANMEYRTEVKKIYAECSIQAQASLAKHRRKRQRAIESGSYRVSLSSLTNKNRVSFAQKDDRFLQRRYQECLLIRKPEFKNLKEVYNQKMRVIEQQKEQYQKKMELLKQKMQSLNKMAYEQQNELIQEYTKKMEKVISEHARQYAQVLKTYQRNKQTLLAETSKINVLEKQLVEKRQKLQLTKRDLITEQQVIAYLKSKGVSDEEEDNYEAYSEAAGALESYYNAVYVAYDECNCSDRDNKSNICKRIKKHKSRLMDKDMDVVIDKVAPGSGVR